MNHNHCDIDPCLICIIKVIVILFMISMTLSVLLSTTYQVSGSLFNTGSGQYQGIIVETGHHGILFQTYGVHLKTGENSNSFEDFCVLDESLFERISNIPKDKKVLIIYNKKLSTPPWQCDYNDSNDIIKDVRIIE